jgi:hypothetical protein
MSVVLKRSVVIVDLCVDISDIHQVKDHEDQALSAVMQDQE